MRRKLSLLAASALIGSVMTVGGASPAQACHYDVVDDPVLGWACYQTHSIPDVEGWVQHYYDSLGRAVKTAYCKLWPSDPSC